MNDCYLVAVNSQDLPIVLYSIAEIGRFLQSEPGGHCFTQKPFFSFLLNDTGQGVSMHVKSPSRLKHIRPKNRWIRFKIRSRQFSEQSKFSKHRYFRVIDVYLFHIWNFALRIHWRLRKFCYQHWVDSPSDKSTCNCRPSSCNRAGMWARCYTHLCLKTCYF